MQITRRLAIAALAAAALLPAPLRAEEVKEIRVDWATYNPVSMLIRDQGLLEKEFAADGIKITWVQSAGSNKALEFLSANAIDFGSTAGGAALVGRINGNPIKAIYAFSRPEWTALVTRPETGITKVEDLKGRSVAVTRGTDPHIFLIRALAGAGLTEKDLNVVLLQHADGRTALMRGDVDAWAGLDPMMAAAEVEQGAKLFYRNPAANTWGVLNVRETFLAENPEIVARVLKVYEQGRKQALADPAALKAVVGKVTNLPPEVVSVQIDQRTDLTKSRIGPEQREAILAAGKALQEAGVVAADVDVAVTVDALLEDRLPPGAN